MSEPIVEEQVAKATPRTASGGYVDITTTGGLAARVPVPEGVDPSAYAERLDGQRVVIGGRRERTGNNEVLLPDGGEDVQDLVEEFGEDAVVELDEAFVSGSSAIHDQYRDDPDPDWENMCTECGDEAYNLRCGSCGRPLCSKHAELGAGHCSDFGRDEEGRPGCEVAGEFLVAEHMLDRENRSDDEEDDDDDAKAVLPDGGTSDTPLPGQVRCPHGHLCSSGDRFCRECGMQLVPEEGESA